MPTAVLMKDRAEGWNEHLTVSADGLRGHRHYRITGADAADWNTASGLPAIGADWSGGNPTLRAHTIDPVAEHGPHVIVRVEYRDIAAGGFAGENLAQPGEKWSQTRDSPQQVQVLQDRDGEPLPEGVTVEVNTELLEVVAFVNSVTHREHWRSIRNKVNSNSVLLPGPRSLPASTQTAAAGELLARDFVEEDVREGVMKVTFRFGLAPNWKGAIPIRDDAGDVIDTELRDVIPEIAYNPTLLWG